MIKPISLFQILLLDKYTLCASEYDNKRLYSLVFLKSLTCSILEMSTLFVLLDYCVIILISALYNPSHCLFVDQIGEQVYA